MLTCEDLGFAPDDGHTDLWPAVIDHLAVTWGKNITALRRHLDGHYTGLPRGRVTRLGRCLIMHGEDAPVADWLPMVVRSFRLERVRYRAVYDEHERRLPDDRRRLHAVLGTSIPAPTGGRSELRK